MAKKATKGTNRQAKKTGKGHPITTRPDRDRRVRQNARVARVLSVLNLIQSRGRWTARAIAEELESSERTVYRDLEVLEFAGVPWYRDPSDHTIRVRPDFRFPVMMLTDDELLGQAVATALTKAPGLNVTPGATPTTRKLAATSNEKAQQLLEDASRLIEVLDLKIADHSRHHDALKTVQSALLRQRQLTGHYESPYEPVPVKLIEMEEYVYVAHKQKLGESHTATLRSAYNLAVSRLEAGDYSEAIKLLERARDLHTKVLPRNHPEALSTLGILASGYRAAGRVAEAIELLEHVRQLQTETVGEQHPDMVNTLKNLAWAYEDSKEYRQAIQLYGRAYEISAKISGIDHPVTLAIQNGLAAAHGATGNYAKAIEIYSRLREVVVRVLGENHPSNMTVLGNLANAHREIGDRSTASQLFEQAAQIAERRRFINPQAEVIVANAIHLHEAAGRWGLAATWQRKWLLVLKERSGTDSFPYAAQLAALGLNLLREEKWSEAEEALREALTTRRQHQPEEWTTFNSMSALGGAYLGQERFSKAEPLLVEGYEGMKAREDKIPEAAKVRLTEAVQRLVDLYTAWEKPEEAARWKAKLNP